MLTAHSTRQAPTEQGEIWCYDSDYPSPPTTYNPVFVSALVDVALPYVILCSSPVSGRN